MKAIVIRKRILHRIVLRYVRPASTNSGLQVTRCRLERHSGHDTTVNKQYYKCHPARDQITIRNTTVNKQYYKCHPARDLITIRNGGNCFSQVFINIAVICTCDMGGLLNADMSGDIPFSLVVSFSSGVLYIRTLSERRDL